MRGFALMISLSLSGLTDSVVIYAQRLRKVRRLDCQEYTLWGYSTKKLTYSEPLMHPEGLNIILAITVGFSLAFVLGLLAQTIRLSPILGYLVAGYLIGPHSPGYVADLAVAEQLSEIGIVLLMFSVGLHFSWDDLMRVRGIAIPGAIWQTTVATVLGLLVILAAGGTLGAGLIVGLAIGVASTVVLIRMLTDYNLLATTQGHIAVGWLIVEDLITVLILIILPHVATVLSGDSVDLFSVSSAIGLLILKMALLGLIIYFIVMWVAKSILLQVSRTRSYELLTLALLTIIFSITTSGAYFFGVSLALGAFISGMVVAKTDVSHQAAAFLLPMKDAFAALFFISVGMLFNPMIIPAHWMTFVGLLAVILVAKPLTALIIVYLYRYPFKTASIVAIALAQIGEFSFILAEESWRLKIIPDIHYDLLVACAVVTIALNPLLFRLSLKYEKRLGRKAKLKPHTLPPHHKEMPSAILVGYGPIGRNASKALLELGIRHEIIDHNIDTIAEVKRNGLDGIYGDATFPNILEHAQLAHARWLIITVPEFANTVAIIQTTRQLNPNIEIIARANYITDAEKLEKIGVSAVCCETETAKAFLQALRSLVIV